MGAEDLVAYLDKYDIELDPYFDGILEYPKQDLTKFINSSNMSRCSPEAIDFLSTLLQYDHQLRPTAKEAMAHPYFDPVRKEIMRAETGLDDIGRMSVEVSKTDTDSEGKL